MEHAIAPTRSEVSGIEKWGEKAPNGMSAKLAYPTSRHTGSVITYSGHYNNQDRGWGQEVPYRDPSRISPQAPLKNRMCMVETAVYEGTPHRSANPAKIFTRQSQFVLL